MKKVLIVSTVSRQFFLFEKTNISILKEKGYEIHCAANYEDRNARLDDLGIIEHDFPIQRSPLKFIKNYKAYRQLIRLIDDINPSFIHCHSPVGGLIARLAAKKRNKKIIYTAHGFHFYKGAPALNWLLYYPVEKWLAHYTDYLITINNEDYELAQHKFQLKAGGKIIHIPGIGVDLKYINSIKGQSDDFRKELQLDDEATLLISVGELIKRKNHEVILKALTRLPDHVHYVICGRGQLLEELQTITSQFNLSNRVHFLGYRSDIIKVLKSCDIFVFPSFQEGLPVSLMEAMACELPCVVSNIRGNNELILDKDLLCECSNSNQYYHSIMKLMNDETFKKAKIDENLNNILNFSKDIVIHDMEKLYSLLDTSE